ncbi:hypothetical protein BSK54_08030 [Paenibacillus odorifer]|jgi:hypothetical protein|uniref:hypothetical protein n=1 Tax=Paenibacillus odorifer TaxID=189426 RepID=UPI00096D0891|nr:hypothetical protein [Paenibacillus odorifer]OME03390.1 hypothetical protein BSK54_08030 [Paenibacillus odorifer]
MFIFFFGSSAPQASKGKYRPGVVCEIIRNDPRHVSMPNMYPDRIGQEVMITEIAPDPKGWVWGYEIRFGKRPTSVQPYQMDWLKPLSTKQAMRVLRLAE